MQTQDPITDKKLNYNPRAVYPEFNKLLAVVERLRDPLTGCPWDLKQTHISLLKHLIEESYEFVSAVELHQIDGMKEELGDVLLQVLLHSTIAKQSGLFHFEEVCKVLTDKLIFRHEHVFGSNEFRRADGSNKLTSEEALKTWNTQKQLEKDKKGSEENKGVEPLLDYALLSFPALHASYKIGKRSQDIRFDWDSPLEAFQKVIEEFHELKEEVEQNRTELIEEELGDLLFTLAQYARHLKVNPEEILKRANRKFYDRFMLMAQLMEGDGIITSSNSSTSFKEIAMAEKDIYWMKAKALQKKSQMGLRRPLKSTLNRLTVEQRCYHLPMPIIGITGGVASGKSQVVSYLREQGYPVIVGDELVKEIYKREESIYFIKTHFPHVMKSEGKEIDFSKLRMEFFEKSESKKRVENFIWPLIPSFFYFKLNLIEQNCGYKKIPYLFYENPIIFEQNMAPKFDTIISVATTLELQKERLLKRDNTSMATISKILEAQIPGTQLLNLAEWVIDNRGPLSDLNGKIEETLNLILE